MALKTSSLFLYGFQVTQSNSSIDFKVVSGGPEKKAILNLGYYSLSSLAIEIKRAMEAASPGSTFTVSINRNVFGGLENRVTISTSGVFLSLLFGTGSRAASSTAPLIGFTSTDKTGATSYTGQFSAGTRLVPNMIGYSFLSPDFEIRNFGAVNVSASGKKESIVFQIQQFFQVQFKYIPTASWNTEWSPMVKWMVQQRLIEFTPEVSSPNTFYEGTLENTNADGKGLAFKATEMLPQFPDNYDTGVIRFRWVTVSPTFI